MIAALLVSTVFILLMILLVMLFPAFAGFLRGVIITFLLFFGTGIVVTYLETQIPPPPHIVRERAQQQTQGE